MKNLFLILVSNFAFSTSEVFANTTNIVTEVSQLDPRTFLPVRSLPNEFVDKNKLWCQLIVGSQVGLPGAVQRAESWLVGGATAVSLQNKGMRIEATMARLEPELVPVDKGLGHWKRSRTRVHVKVFNHITNEWLLFSNYNERKQGVNSIAAGDSIEQAIEIENLLRSKQLSLEVNNESYIIAGFRSDAIHPGAAYGIVTCEPN